MKVRSERLPENRKSVFCDVCGKDFISYANTLEMALYCHREKRFGCVSIDSSKKRRVETVHDFMIAEGNLEYDEIPEGFNGPNKGDGLFNRLILEKEIDEEVVESASSRRDPTNERNTRSRGRAPGPDVDIYCDGRESEDEVANNAGAEEDEGLNEALQEGVQYGEEEEMRAGDRCPIDIGIELPLCDFLDIVKKEKVQYLPVNDFDRREKWNKVFVGDRGFTPSFVGLEFQRFLMAYYPDASEYMHLNKKDGEEVDMEIALRFHRFITKTHLSSNEGEELFNLVFKTFGKKLGGKEYPMPQYRAVKKTVNKNTAVCSPTLELGMAVARRH